MPPITTSRIMDSDRDTSANNRDPLDLRLQALIVLTLAKDFCLNHANF